MDKKVKILVDTITDTAISNTTFRREDWYLIYHPPFFKWHQGVEWFVWEGFYEKDYEEHLLNQSSGLEMIKDYFIEQGILKESDIDKLMPYLYRSLRDKTFKAAKKYC